MSADTKDLVLRLRARKTFAHSPNDIRWIMPDKPDADCAEAADRIEALEQERDEARIALTTEGIAATKRISELTARLRAALVKRTFKWEDWERVETSAEWEDPPPAPLPYKVHLGATRKP
jgi:hypothetical protein